MSANDEIYRKIGKGQNSISNDIVEINRNTICKIKKTLQNGEVILNPGETVNDFSNVWNAPIKIKVVDGVLENWEFVGEE